MNAIQNYFKAQYFIARNLEKMGAVVRPTVSHGNGTRENEFRFVVSTLRVDYKDRVYYIDFRNARDKNDGTYTVPSSVAVYDGLPTLNELAKVHFMMDFENGFSQARIEEISTTINTVIDMQ